MSDAEIEGLVQGRDMLAAAERAGSEYQHFDFERVSRIVQEVANVAYANAARLAEMTVAETGFGVVADKTSKNESHSRGFLQEYLQEDFCSPRVSRERRMVEFPRPAGVILAVTPSTGPVACTFFKCLSALLTRNAIVVSPHPAAARCTAEAARLLAEAATRAGAPPGLIQVVEKPSVPLVEALMADTRVGLILATGGMGVVKAAYRSGNPAIGVGPGNPPVVVDETANLERAADSIVRAKVFDNSVTCTTESVLFVVEQVADRVVSELRSRGAYLCSPSEVDRLRAYMYPDGGFNSAVVGRSAAVIAAGAGFVVPPSTTVLLAPFDHVVAKEGLTHEKLSPVLGLRVVRDFEQAVTEARDLVNVTGLGHSAAIHSEVPQRVLDFGAALHVMRIAVNMPCAFGAAGWGTSLPSTMSIGTGFVGGSSSGDNLSPHLLVQWERLVYPNQDAEVFPDFGGLRPAVPQARVEWATVHSPGAPSTSGPDIRDELRRLVVDELRTMMGARHG